MTTIVAYQTDEFAVIASDSRTTADTHIVDNEKTKIHQVGEILIASAGNTRGSNIVNHQWKPPALRTKSIENYLSSSLIPSLRKVFIDGGYDIKEDGNDAEHNSSFIIAIRGELFEIWSDYSWTRSQLYGTGSGSSYAMGAARAMKVHEQETPEDVAMILREAVEVAISFDSASGGDVHVAYQLKK